MMRVAVINGPNLNLLGTRQPEVYGELTLAELEGRIGTWAAKIGVEVDVHQSNDESELVDLIQRAAAGDGVILNAGGYTHTSVAIADAVAAIPIPVVEVHLSDIHHREPFRDSSLIEANAIVQIAGRGATGYRDALRYLVNHARSPATTVRYGPHPRNVADLRRAPGATAIVVLVHGGFWLPGWDKDQLDSAAIDLTGRGLDTLTVEYRVEPPWPGSGHDVAMAAAYAGSLHDRIGLVGHSAGGYLALWSQRRAPVTVCVGLAPVTDLDALDDVPAACEVVEAGGPARLGLPADTYLFHGSDDNDVAPSQSTRLGGEPNVVLLEGVGHFDLIDPRRPHWERVASTLCVPLGA